MDRERHVELKESNINEIWKQVNKVVNELCEDIYPLEHVTLRCQNNGLTYLPDTLPRRLTRLDCSGNQLTYLPDTLPRRLTRLDCSGNQLTSLPNNFPRRLTRLDCSNNQLTSLPETLPQGLTVLDCSNNLLISLPMYLPQELSHLFCCGNQLTSLPETLPQDLTDLWCCNNQLTSLPDNLPRELVTLFCFHNRLTSLPNNLPRELTKLWCSRNQLTSLPDNLPRGLTRLYCHDNNLISLPENLPQELTELCCSNNHLTSLPENLPQGLTELNCSNNYLTSLPYSILFCRRLEILFISDNPFERHHEAVQRFLTRIENRQQQSSWSTSIYTNSQSVHNSTIQGSVSRAILTIIKIVTPEQRRRFSMPSVLSDSILSPSAKESIVEYCKDKTLHSILLVTFEEVFRDVWILISSHPTSSEELKRILNKELQDSLCKCFTGRLSRLISSLSGGFFPEHPEFEIKISSSEQIANIISLTRDKLQSTGSYTLDSHRQLVRKELEERSYSSTVIEEWLSFLDE